MAICLAVFTVKVKVKLSLWDAIKLRIMSGSRISSKDDPTLDLQALLDIVDNAKRKKPDQEK